MKEDPSEELTEYIERIRQGEVDALSLTIYGMNPYILTQYPVRKQDLIESWYEYKITISGEKLAEYIDFVEKVANAPLIPVEEQGYDGFARLYYVFETKYHRKIFSVCMWNGKGGIFVNGAQVEAGDAFYDVVLPFLPRYASEKWEIYSSDYSEEQKDSNP